MGNLQDGLPMPSATSMTAGMENVFAEPGSPRIFLGSTGFSTGLAKLVKFRSLLSATLSARSCPEPGRVKLGTRPVQDIFE